MLHRSTASLEGTAYFEFLPGPYRDVCWGPNSVFLDEEAFGFIEPIFHRLVPKYDHYAFTTIGCPLWRDILAEFDDVSRLLAGNPDDVELRARLGFFFTTTDSDFFANRSENATRLRGMITDLAEWLSTQLETHDVVTVLGL